MRVFYDRDRGYFFQWSAHSSLSGTIHPYSYIHGSCNLFRVKFINIMPISSWLLGSHYHKVPLHPLHQREGRLLISVCWLWCQGPLELLFASFAPPILHLRKDDWNSVWLLLFDDHLLLSHSLTERLGILRRDKRVSMSGSRFLAVARSAHCLRLELADVSLYYVIPGQKVIKNHCWVDFPSFVAIKPFQRLL